MKYGWLKGFPIIRLSEPPFLMGLTLPVTEIHHQKGAYDSLYMDDVCPMKVFDAKEKCQYIQYDESIIQVDGS